MHNYPSLDTVIFQLIVHTQLGEGSGVIFYGSNARKMREIIPEIICNLTANNPQIFWEKIEEFQKKLGTT